MRPLPEEALETLKRKFEEYYARKQPPLPPGFAQREFGFGFEKKIDFRHKAFTSNRDFDYYFKSQAPLYASYSAAYYSLPGARPMERKDWLGADLIFDFDEPRLPKEHYEKEHSALLCPKCLQAILDDTILLKENYLEADFGFSKKDTLLVFSGNKGYHCHVRAEAVHDLKQEARRELLEYTKGPKSMLRKVRDGRVKVLRGPSAQSLGWGKRFYDEAVHAFDSKDALRAYGLREPKISKVFKDKERVLSLLAKGNWDAFTGMEKAWERVFESVRAKYALNPDAQVTLDLARLIRLPDSLHGGTGLLAATVKHPNFNPLSNAVAFSWRRKESVRLKKAIIVEMGGETLELREGENEVPEAVAVLLEAKGLTVSLMT